MDDLWNSSAIELLQSFKMRFSLPVLLGATANVLFPAFADASSSTFQSKCLAFTPAKYIANSTLTHLEFVTAGTTLLFPDNVASCGRASQLVSADICRIALSIPTSYRSSITFELWLPSTWTGKRFLGTGNGGTDGCKSLLYTTPPIVMFSF
jgi:feruloyl esterase